MRPAAVLTGARQALVLVRAHPAVGAARLLLALAAAVLAPLGLVQATQEGQAAWEG